MLPSPIRNHNKSANKVLGPTAFKSNISNTSPKPTPDANQQSLSNTYQHNIRKKLNFKQENDYLQHKSILKQSQKRIASALLMTDFFKQNQQNLSYRQNTYTKILKSSTRIDELQIIHNEHRIQVQKLLLEISRLHDVIYDIERSKKYQLQRLKQQHEEMTYLQISNIKQSQAAQIEILEVQLKKTKDAFLEQTQQLQNMEKAISKQREMFKSEIEMLRSGLKQLVNKKNEELFEIREQNEEKIKEMDKQKSNAIEQMKDACDKQMKKIQRLLRQKEQKLEKFQSQYYQNTDRNTKIQQTLEKEKEMLQQRLKEYIQESNQRYEKLAENVDRMLEQQAQTQDEKQKLLKDLYENEIKNLLHIIKIKGEENNRLRTQLETERFEHRFLLENADNENQELHKKLKDNQLKHLQQLQLLKVKMAILHENDIKSLVKSYDSKIEYLTKELNRSSQQTARLRNYMHEETHRWYENKKQYQFKISTLNVQILRLKDTLANLQKDLKDRLQNERNSMVLTSKSLLRDVELKQTNVKFYEEELRKLRSIIQKLQRESQIVENKLKEQIKNLQEQIKRLLELNKLNAEQNKNVEEQYMKAIEYKDNEIRRLNKEMQEILNNSQADESEDMKRLKKVVDSLKEQLQQKTDKTKDLQNTIEMLEKQLQEKKVYIQKLNLQHEVNNEQSKTGYEQLSADSLKGLKQFYERKISQLESDKQQLKIKLTADQVNITELVRKYQVLEDQMKKMITQCKKRTELEERIIHLGMDNNLVKNKAQLFEKYFQQ